MLLTFWKQRHSIVNSRNFSSFLLQLSVLCMVIIGLTVLRGDASRLVIYPLRRMLKIVLRCKLNYPNYPNLEFEF